MAERWELLWAVQREPRWVASMATHWAGTTAAQMADCWDSCLELRKAETKAVPMAEPMEQHSAVLTVLMRAGCLDYRWVAHLADHLAALMGLSWVVQMVASMAARTAEHSVSRWVALKETQRAVHWETNLAVNLVSLTVEPMASTKADWKAD